MRSSLHRYAVRGRKLVEQSPDAIWVVEDGRLTMSNDAGLDMIGPGGETRRKTPAGPDQGVRLQAQLRRLSGERRSVEISSAEVPGQQGRAI